MTIHTLADTGVVRNLLGLKSIDTARAAGSDPSAFQLTILDDLPARSRPPGLDEHAALLCDRLGVLCGGNHDEMRVRLDRLRALAGLQEDRSTQQAAQYALALLDQEVGLWVRAAQRFEAAGAGSTIGLSLAWCLFREAEVRDEIDPSGRVLGLCARSLRRSRRNGCPMLAARVRLLAASAYRGRGDTQRAWRQLDRVRALKGVSESRPHQALLLLTQARLLQETGRLEAALASCREAEDLVRREGSSARPILPALRPAILRQWGEILLELDRGIEAHRCSMQALESVGPDAPAEEGRIRLLLARLRMAEGKEDHGWEELGRGERLMRRAHAHRSLACLLLFRAEAAALRLHRSADRRLAREGLFEARAIFRRRGRQERVHRCDLLLETIRFPGAGARPGMRLPSHAHPPRVPRMRRLSQLGFLTADPRILQAIEPIESLARTTIPVLVLGESGTGKEVLARALHRAGGGRGSFVGVNCGALPSELQESELFGHVRGAFTGAITDKTGLFEAADGGTLLLDEVGEMSPRAQVKLLRVLELGEVRRVGEIRTRKICARVIAATNADLGAKIRGGTFRRDLYYRLCGLKVDLPPLRDRLGDVPLLASHFVTLFGNHEAPPPSLAPDALDLLLQHSWPGNVRELRFTVEKAVALTKALGRERVEADCIDLEPPTEESGETPSNPSVSAEEVISAGGLEAYVANIERRLILKALEENGWNRTRAAKALGALSRTTLIGKMKRLGLFPGPGGQS